MSFPPGLDLACAAGSLLFAIVEVVRWRRGGASGWWPLFWVALTAVFLTYAIGERLGIIHN